MTWCAACDAPLDVVPAGSTDALLCEECVKTHELGRVVDLTAMAEEEVTQRTSV